MGFFRSLWKEIVEIFYPSGNVKTVGKFTASEVDRILRENGITCQIKITDRTYAIVDDDCVAGSFYNYYASLLDKLGIKNWREDYDCDSFSLFFVGLIQISHYVSRTDTEGPGLGFVQYRPTGSPIDHVLVMKLNKDRSLRYFEPQSGSFKELSKCERNSMSFVYF